jgi:hypothetical protein
VSTLKLETDCFGAHRVLATHARELSRRLAGVRPGESDLLRLGAGCVQLAAERGLAARDDYRAALAWNECSLGDRQIRAATYRALAAGAIGNREYDHVFCAAIVAARARREELARLRSRLSALALV